MSTNLQQLASRGYTRSRRLQCLCFPNNPANAGSSTGRSSTLWRRSRGTISTLRRNQTCSPAELRANVLWERNSRSSISPVRRGELNHPIPLSRAYGAVARDTASSASAVPSQLSVALSSGSVEKLLREICLEREFLENLAQQRPLPLRLKDMYQYGTSTDHGQRLRNAQFLYKELPVRIAQRAVDLLTLPHGLSEAIPIQQVARIYLQFLRRFRDFPYPTTVEQEGLFTDMLHSFLLDRSSVPVSIAQGLKAWWLKEQHGNKDDRLQEMEEALYRFFTARVGLRFLTEHFVLSSNRESARSLRSTTSMFPLSEESHTSQKVRGCIHANVDVLQEIRRAAEVVTYQTKEYYDGLCPEIDIVDCVSDHEFTHVPHHLHYMVSELLKNACRASVRKYKETTAAAGAGAGSDSNIEIPPIRVIVVKGEEDVTIKVADKGGGIKRSLMATIWKFAHSTANEDEQQAEFGTDGESGARIRGFGLPLARIYARYFGGELTLKSTEGYGLDAYLHLPRLGDSCESLPLRVRDSPGARDSLPSSKSTLSSFTKPVQPRPMRYFSTQEKVRTHTATTSSDRSITAA